MHSANYKLNTIFEHARDLQAFPFLLMKTNRYTMRTQIIDASLSDEQFCLGVGGRSLRVRVSSAQRFKERGCTDLTIFT